MSINAVGFNCGYYPFGSQLSEETRRKLLALGIDPSTVNSEAQAQMIIYRVQSLQSTQHPTEISSYNHNPGEQELISRAKSLASKLGISIPQGTPLGEILKILGAKVDSFAQQAGNDEEQIAKVRICQNELAEIISEFTTVKQNEDAMFASMNFNANMNKMIFGL